MTEGRKLLLSQNEKRQSTAALQNASRVRGRVVSPTGFGVRLCSAAFGREQAFGL